MKKELRIRCLEIEKQNLLESYDRMSYFHVLLKNGCADKLNSITARLEEINEELK